MCTCGQVMEFEESMIFHEEESGMELLKRDDFDDLKGFTIALFSPYEEEEASYQLVPVSWINKEYKTCAYPQGLSKLEYSKAVKKMRSPPLHWEYFQLDGTLDFYGEIS